MKHKATFHKNIESPLKTSYDKEMLITEQQDNKNTPITKTFNCSVPRFFLPNTHPRNSS